MSCLPKLVRLQRSGEIISRASVSSAPVEDNCIKDVHDVPVSCNSVEAEVADVPIDCTAASEDVECTQSIDQLHARKRHILAERWRRRASARAAAAAAAAASATADETVKAEADIGDERAKISLLALDHEVVAAAPHESSLPGLTGSRSSSSRSLLAAS